MRIRLVHAVIGCVVALAGVGAGGQGSNRLSDPQQASASRWQADVVRMDDAMRTRVLSGDAPRSRWLAAEIDRSDIDSQVANLAQARNRVPTEKLYLASLALACLERVQPLPAACDATDRLADWATRDADNGLPSLLLAERAQQRNNGTSMLAYLEEAATRPRFDDYRARGGLFIWEEVRLLPGSDEAAARVELAATWGLARPAYGTGSLQSLCRDAARFGDTARGACAAVGNAMAQRGSTWMLRTAGARIAERNATTPDAQARAAAQLADVQRRAYDCAQQGNPVATALQSPDAAVRAAAVAQWDARLRREADVGEVATCAAG
jgi:hypothetical protein